MTVRKSSRELGPSPEADLINCCHEEIVRSIAEFPIIGSSYYLPGEEFSGIARDLLYSARNLRRTSSDVSAQPLGGRGERKRKEALRVDRLVRMSLKVFPTTSSSSQVQRRVVDNDNVSPF